MWNPKLSVSEQDESAETLKRDYSLMAKEPDRSVDIGLFLSWLREHKHPRFLTVDIKVDKSNAEARDLLGLPPVCTILFATTLGREWLEEPIPRHILPTYNTMTRRWNEDRMKWEDGEMVRGWRPVLKTLAKRGFLKPSHKLTYLLGKDSFAEVPREFHP